MNAGNKCQYYIITTLLSCPSWLQQQEEGKIIHDHPQPLESQYIPRNKFLMSKLLVTHQLWMSSCAINISIFVLWPTTSPGSTLWIYIFGLLIDQLRWGVVTEKEIWVVIFTPELLWTIAFFKLIWKDRNTHMCLFFFPFSPLPARLFSPLIFLMLYHFRSPHLSFSSLPVHRYTSYNESLFLLCI